MIYLQATQVIYLRAVYGHLLTSSLRSLIYQQPKVIYFPAAQSHLFCSSLENKCSTIKFTEDRWLFTRLKHVPSGVIELAMMTVWVTASLYQHVDPMEVAEVKPS